MGPARIGLHGAAAYSRTKLLDHAMTTLELSSAAEPTTTFGGRMRHDRRSVVHTPRPQAPSRSTIPARRSNDLSPGSLWAAPDESVRDAYEIWIEHQAETGAIVLTAQVIGVAIGCALFGLSGALIGAWVVGAIADYLLAQNAPHSGGPSKSQELRVLRAVLNAVPAFGPAVPLLQAASHAPHNRFAAGR
jgi:hypothetical protein